MNGELMYKIVLLVVHIYAVVSVGFTTAHLYFWLRRRSALRKERATERSLSAKTSAEKTGRV